MSEEWRPIAGYDGWYEVSNEGRVRSWHKNKWGRLDEPRLMQGGMSNSGYLRVSLMRGTVTDYRHVHRLVLDAFGPPPGPGAFHCAHWDGDELNNRIENLRWATPKENGEDRARHGSLKGSRHPLAKLCDRDVRTIRRLRGGGMKHVDIAKRIGSTKGAVGAVCRGSTWAHVV